MTPYSSGPPSPNSQIKSIGFYLGGLRGLSPTQRLILFYLIDCVERGPPAIFQPGLVTLARMCGCSRRTVMAALDGLDGWIVRDWRGGQKTNIYLPGWRLKRILQRYRTKRGKTTC